MALSRGVSFTAYQPGEPCGSLTTNAPSPSLSSVGIQPSIDSSGSTIGTASPAYSTVTRKCSPFFSFFSGQITSSCPCSWRKSARRKSTVTRETVRVSRRSRLKRYRFWVARARITVTPSRASLSWS